MRTMEKEQERTSKLEFYSGHWSITASIQHLVIAGWTGRDATAVEHHIAELEAIGVARPRTVPCFYRVGANLLTTNENVEVCGSDSSGEAEVVLLAIEDELYVGVGSDHTDRRLEAFGVTVSKQMCPKPIGRELWPFADLKLHWDEMILRSWVARRGERMLYQEGPMSRMLTPKALINAYLGKGQSLEPNTAMFCGTLPVLGEIGPSDRFEVELEDPVRRRRLRHGYNARSLAYRD
jgi:Protein of unknown function (DUF2848)